MIPLSCVSPYAAAGTDARLLIPAGGQTFPNRPWPHQPAETLNAVEMQPLDWHLQQIPLHCKDLGCEEVSPQLGVRDAVIPATVFAPAGAQILDARLAHSCMDCGCEELETHVAIPAIVAEIAELLTGLQLGRVV